MKLILYSECFEDVFENSSHSKEIERRKVDDKLRVEFMQEWWKGILSIVCIKQKKGLDSTTQKLIYIILT